MNSRKQRILVVDDDVEFAESLADVLVEAGHQVETVHAGEAAIDAAHRQPYDAAIVDLKMPGIDGIQTCHRLKQAQSELTAVIVTAYMGSEQLQRVTEHEIERVFPKPAPLDELLAVLDSGAPGDEPTSPGAAP